MLFGQVLVNTFDSIVLIMDITQEKIEINILEDVEIEEEEIDKEKEIRTHKLSFENWNNPLLLINNFCLSIVPSKIHGDVFTPPPERQH